MKNKINFIIIDDDPINNKLCRHIIKNTIGDTDIIDFTLPSKAVEYVETTTAYDNSQNPVILLDINMPIINGWDFLELFSEMNEEVRKKYKIYILSSSIDERDVERANEHKHVSGYISKPLTKEKVISILEKLEKKD